MVMTKSDLVAQVAQETKLTKADAERAITAVFSGIQGALKQGKEARFIGFGSFSVQKSNAREGRNPRTGEKITIKASKRPVFRAGKDFKEAVNTGR
jgi:DNA-binding protein HU-beta